MENNDRRAHVKPGPAKYTKGYKARQFVSSIIRVVIILIGIGALIASTYIYVKEPVKTSEGYVLTNVVRRMYKIDEEVLVVEDKSQNVFTPLKRAIINQQPRNMVVIAGPYGEIKEADEAGEFKAVYASSTSRVNLDITEERYLDEEYIVREVDADGKHITSKLDLIVNKNAIIGLIDETGADNNNIQQGLIEDNKIKDNEEGPNIEFEEEEEQESSFK